MRTKNVSIIIIKVGTSLFFEPKIQNERSYVMYLLIELGLIFRFLFLTIGLLGLIRGTFLVMAERRCNMWAVN